MIENIRKYTGLMTVVFVLLFIGLLYMGNGSNQGYGSGPTVLTAHGTEVPRQAFDRIGVNPVRLLNALSGSSMQARFALLEYLYTMAPSDNPNSRDPFDYRRFFVNRINLQKGAEEFGLHASDTEIEEFLRERIFVTNTGDFDQTAYDRFSEDGLPRLGMGQKELYETLGEVLIYQKFSELIGSGLVPSRETLRNSVEDGLQQVDYQLVEFKASTYEAKQDPTEEEVRAFWETNKGRYLSPPRRKLSYVVAKPDFSTALEKKKKASEPALPEAQDNTETPQVEEPVAEAVPPVAPPVIVPPVVVPPAIEPPVPVVLSREEREEIIELLGHALVELEDEIIEAKGANFVKLAKEKDYAPVTTELITEADLPVVLRGSIRDHTISGAKAIFQQPFPGATLMDRISDPIRIGDNWILFQIDAAEEAQELSFDEAKDDVRLDLIKETAYKQMAEAAEEAREKLVSALAEGTSFADAAAALELTPVAREKASANLPSPDEPTPRELFALVSRVNPGEVSKVLTQTNKASAVFRSVLTYVEKRELVDDENLRNTLEQGYQRQESNIKRLAFSNWLARQYSAAEVSLP